MHVDKVVAITRDVRRSLLKLQGVLGIGHGWKVRRGRRTAQYAIRVYVAAKRPLAEVQRDEHIPKRIAGAPTDVVAVSTATTRLEDEHEHRFIDYAKVHRELQRRRLKALPSTANDRDIGDVAVVEDDPNHSFIIPERKDVDWVGAYNKFRRTHGDHYDFVTFWSDFEVACDCGAFYCGLANPAKGINWTACMPGGRRGWDSNRLQAFMYFIRDDDAALLQEIGHHWMAFTGFKAKPAARNASYAICLDNQPGHWSTFFDDDASPMDYDESELGLPSGVSVDWVDNGDGTFTPRRVGQGQYRYCNLDIYLMGLIPPQEVGGFFYIRNPRRVGAKLRGQRITLTVDNIIWANGRRRPGAATSPKSFTNAFILLTRDTSRAAETARRIDAIRRRYTAAFAAATGNRAHVVTTL